MGVALIDTTVQWSRVTGVTLVMGVGQRWANSVLMTEYEYEYYSTFQKWPNTNTNIIRFEKGDRIRIRILFGFKKTTEYEYEYYSVWKNGPNTNTNIIRLEKITQIRIQILVLGLNFSNNIQLPNYSLTSASREVHHDIIHGVPHTNVIRFIEKSWPNTTNIRILFGFKILTEYEYEYYSVWKNRPNTNTNIIRFEKIDWIRIRILFGLKKSPEYEYEY